MHINFTFNTKAMKICLISFDYWGFDQHIAKELKSRDNVEVSHIDLSRFRYKYPSFFHRIANTFNKVFLGKNTKKLKRQEHVVQQLKAVGKQDIVLIIRPDLLDKTTHNKVKQFTHNYYAYLYDSTKRFPVDHLMDGTFDKMFSFDENDVKKYNFNHITNYIYLPKKEIISGKKYKQQAFIVISSDERLSTLNRIAQQLDGNKISHKFIVKASRRPAGLHDTIQFSEKEIWNDELLGLLDESEVFLDLIRHNHNGLSFRVFEALAFQRKFITTNASIKNYDFYNPENILVIDEENPEIDPAFFEGEYKPLDEAIYNKYTIKHWVNTVFNL